MTTLTHDRLIYWQRAAQNAHDDRPGTVLSVPAEELLALVDLAQRVEAARLHVESYSVEEPPEVLPKLVLVTLDEYYAGMWTE